MLSDDGSVVGSDVTSNVSRSQQNRKPVSKHLQQESIARLYAKKEVQHALPLSNESEDGKFVAQRKQRFSER